MFRIWTLLVKPKISICEITNVQFLYAYVRGLKTVNVNCKLLNIS